MGSDEIISSSLISFSKLKEFVSNFNPKTNGKLSSILLSLIKDDQTLKLQVKEFKNIVSGIEKDNIHKLLKYILEALHNELTESKTNLNEDYPSINKVQSILSKNKDSIIQKLFFGIKQNQLNCCKCHNETTNYQILVLNDVFTLPKGDPEVDLRDFIKDFVETDYMEKYCNICKKEVKNITKYKIIDFPEIFIMVFDKIDNSILNYRLSFKISNQKYKLVGFIMYKDEYNKNSNNPNVFYLEGDTWFIYKIEDNKKKEIKAITEIYGNPLVVFYQRNKKEFNRFYEKIPLLLKDQENILELANEHLVSGIEYENYYVLNKDWLNKLLKIYENPDKYDDNSYIVDSMEKVTNIKKLCSEKIKEKYLNFIERKKNLEEENLFKVTFKKEDKKSNDIYPKNFFLIKENILNDILKTLGISNDKFKKYLFGVLIGENYLFIKNNNNSNNETIYACYLNDKNFCVVAILNYFIEGYFLKEVNKHIINRGGLEYYYHKRKLILSREKQDIKDRENDIVGYLINKEEIKNAMIMFKFDPSYQNEKELNTFINVSKEINNSNFSNQNYGNSFSNQFNENNLILNNINTVQTFQKNSYQEN